MKSTLLLTAACILAASQAFAQTSFTHVECGTEFTMALRSDSTLWACGNNGNGQLGVDTGIVSSDTLLQAAAGRKWIYAATGGFHVAAIAADSTLWGWGYNGDGELGIGIANQPDAPQQVSTTTHWRYVSAGEAHTLAIRNDGTLWGTGYNADAELGTGDTMQQLSYVQIGTDNTWKTVSAGGVFSLGVKEDGTLWGWGYNGDGELGMNNTTPNIFAPTQIGTATDWVMASAGFEFSLAMKTDGTIWSAGFNGNKQLGRITAGAGDSVFAQIGTASNWKYIAAASSFGFGIQQDGTLWGWGFNTYGQLGIVPPSASSAVTQVGTDTTWSYVSGADGANTGSSILGLHSAGFKHGVSGLCTTGADYIGQTGNGSIIAPPSAQFGFNCSIGESTTVVSNVEKNEELVTVYPNPAYEVLHIDGIATTGDYRIVNMVGAEVQKGSLAKGVNDLSIQGFVPGVYLVTINTAEGQRYNVRFVKQ